MDLGNKIKNIRYNYNLSQEELAKMLEINRNYLSRIETNKSLPTAEILAKLAKNFNISVDSLLETNVKDTENSAVRDNKIKRISQYCRYLTLSELDFVINLVCIMSNNTRSKE